MLSVLLDSTAPLELLMVIHQLILWNTTITEALARPAITAHLALHSKYPAHQVSIVQQLVLYNQQENVILAIIVKEVQVRKIQLH